MYIFPGLMGCPPLLSQPYLWPPLAWASLTAISEDILVNVDDDYDGLGLYNLTENGENKRVMAWQNLTKYWVKEKNLDPKSIDETVLNSHHLHWSHMSTIHILHLQAAASLALSGRRSCCFVGPSTLSSHPS